MNVARSLTDMPTSLADVLALSSKLNAECIVFDPNDRVVFANMTARQHYPFIDFSSATFKGLFWGGIRHNLVSVDDLPLPPPAYLAMAESSRRAYDRADFIKRYAAGDLICHHRSAANWSIQARLPRDDLRFGGVRPASLTEAAALLDQNGRERFALEALATGIVYLTAAGKVTWANPAGAGLLPAVPSDALKAIVTTALATPGRCHLLALPVPGGQPVLGTVEAFTNREALILLAPPVNATQLAGLLGEIAGLTPIQAQIATLVAAGTDTHAAAASLKREWSTVRFQLSRIFQRVTPFVNSSQTGLTHLVCRLAAIAGASRRPH